MESIYFELALCDIKHFCVRTDTAFFPISEVSDGMVSLVSRKTEGNRLTAWDSIYTEYIRSEKFAFKVPCVTIED